MKQLTLFLAVLLIGLFASTLRPAAALENWPPLLTCSDVSADGRVNIIDIGWLVVKFGAAYPNDDYMLLYDVSGDGFVNIIDIGTAVVDFGRICSLTNHQVAQATLAMSGAYGGPDLRDPQNALDAGYVKSSQNVPQMGIHLFNETYMRDWPECCGLGLPGEETESQLIHPVGLVYTADSSGPLGLGELIGAWYIQPNDVVCDFYGITTPCMPEDQSQSAVQPIGFGEFNNDEDNLDPDGSGPQGGWHFHIDLCIWNWGEANASVFEGVSQTSCVGSDGLWFSTYGWMLHLYNFIPNPAFMPDPDPEDIRQAGRFQKWNSNVPFP
jgi:hypothetical protein